MQDDRAGKAGERVRCLLLGLSTVDDDGHVDLVRQCELRFEDTALLGRGRVPANGVEAGLAHRDDLWVLEQVSQLVQARRVR